MRLFGVEFRKPDNGTDDRIYHNPDVQEGLQFLHWGLCDDTASK